MSTRPVAYPSYADSGVAWLGDVPEHWTTLKAKHLFRRVQRPTRPDDGVVTAFRDGQVTLRSNRRIDGFTNAEKEIGYQGIRKNDLVIHAMDGFAGAIGVSDSDGKSSPVYSVCVPNYANQVNVHYFGYLVRQLAVTGFILALARGIRERSTEFRFSEFRALELAVPLLSEQNQIARFLDYETARIDALIEKQQRLIELLKEKRQAVISHAVTKGLNPDAPMKDSGVEWLGKVPAHWEVVRLGYLAEVGNGSTPSRSVAEYWNADSAEGVGWLSSTKINDEVILEPEQFVSERAVRECHLPMCRSGFVLVAITGEGQTRGRAALLRTETTINQHLSYLAPNQRRISSEFLWRQLQARYDWLRDESAGGGSTRAALTCEFLRGIPICLPPLGEQAQLLASMEARAAVLEQTAAKAAESLTLLQERRTALISAAVTGKIDVRNWKPPADAEASEVA